MPDLTCTRCSKNLSRKTARLIDGKVALLGLSFSADEGRKAVIDLPARIASLIVAYQEEAGDQECSADEYYASILELSKRIVFVVCSEVATEVQLIGTGCKAQADRNPKGEKPQALSAEHESPVPRERDAP